MMEKSLKLISAVVLICSILTACTSSNENSEINVGGDTDNGTTNVFTTETTTEITTAATSTVTSAPEVKAQITTKKDLEGDLVDNNWALFLVNQTHELPKDYSIETKAISGNYVIDERAAEYAIKMFDAAEGEGITLTVISAYRTVEYQQKLFDRDVKEYESQGMTYEQAYAETAKNVAVPGQSEHNAGLAIDILSDDWSSLTEGFETTKAFKWLSENAQDYGFILRYPKGKENITGIVYEPWHYRFVGINNANKIKDSGLCLEEYINNLESK